MTTLFPAQAKTLALAAAFTLATLTGVTAMTGCDNKEKVIDVDTPSDGVEVTKDKDTGAVDVDVDE